MQSSCSVSNGILSCSSDKKDFDTSPCHHSDFYFNKFESNGDRFPSPHSSKPIETTGDDCDKEYTVLKNGLHFISYGDKRCSSFKMNTKNHFSFNSDDAIGVPNSSAMSDAICPVKDCCYSACENKYQNNNLDVYGRPVEKNASVCNSNSLKNCNGMEEYFAQNIIQTENGINCDTHGQKPNESSSNGMNGIDISSTSQETSDTEINDFIEPDLQESDQEDLRHSIDSDHDSQISSLSSSSDRMSPKDSANQPEGNGKNNPNPETYSRQPYQGVEYIMDTAVDEGFDVSPEHTDLDEMPSPHFTQKSDGESMYSQLNNNFSLAAHLEVSQAYNVEQKELIGDLLNPKSCTINNKPCVSIPHDYNVPSDSSDSPDISANLEDFLETDLTCSSASTHATSASSLFNDPWATRRNPYRSVQALLYQKNFNQEVIIDSSSPSNLDVLEDLNSLRDLTLSSPSENDFAESGTTSPKSISSKSSSAKVSPSVSEDHADGSKSFDKSIETYVTLDSTSCKKSSGENDKQSLCHVDAQSCIGNRRSSEQATETCDRVNVLSNDKLCSRQFSGEVLSSTSDFSGSGNLQRSKSCTFCTDKQKLNKISKLNCTCFPKSSKLKNYSQKDKTNTGAVLNGPIVLGKESQITQDFSSSVYVKTNPGSGKVEYHRQDQPGVKIVKDVLQSKETNLFNFSECNVSSKQIKTTQLRKYPSTSSKGGPLISNLFTFKVDPNRTSSNDQLSNTISMIRSKSDAGTVSKIPTCAKSRSRLLGSESSVLPAEVEKVMIWNEYDAYSLQVKQIGNFSSGPTAVVNIFKAFELKIDKEFIIDSIKVNQTLTDMPLPNYLLSKSILGTTAEHLISSVNEITSGEIVGKFFSFYPSRQVNLKEWLGNWMKLGAVPLLTSNLQQHSSQVCLKHTSWHHQMAYGVGPKGIYLTNPLEVVPDDLILKQLNSDALTRIPRDDIIHRWTDTTDLSVFMSHTYPQWIKTNVVGQIVNILREADIPRSACYKPQLTQFITVPTTCQAGVTIFVRNRSPAHEYLITEADHPLS